MDTPIAEVRVDTALVARLIRAQHPDLHGPLRLVESGWDNVIYRLGERLSVRLPRRALAAPLVQNEQRWLPAIAERLPVPIPVPVRVGRPTSYYPWSWSITPWFDGIAAAEVPVQARAAIARELAEVVAAMHVPAPPPDAPAERRAPHSPVRGVPLATRTDAVLDRLASGSIPHADAVRDLWLRAVAVAPWAGDPLWLHGDLHPGNVLLTGATPPQLAAVLDFGDLTAGDPATDLAAGWLFFDAPARAVFRARHDELAGPDRGATADTWRRAVGWAITQGTAMVAHSDDNPRMAALGRHVLEQVLTTSTPI